MVLMNRVIIAKNVLHIDLKRMGKLNILILISVAL